MREQAHNQKMRLADVHDPVCGMNVRGKSHAPFMVHEADTMCSTRRLPIESFGDAKEEVTVAKDWYKDAVIYQLHVRSFCDSNADGVGDFVGLAQKLDYLQELV